MTMVCNNGSVISVHCDIAFGLCMFDRLLTGNVVSWGPCELWFVLDRCGLP